MADSFTREDVKHPSPYFSEEENVLVSLSSIILPSTSYPENNLQSTSLPTQTNIISAQNQNALASTSPIVARYDYAPFGKITKAIGQADLSPLRFSSEVFDPETALTYFNYRYYNPTDGRWISRDPAGESASINLYSFVNNAPTYLNDYLGLEDNGISVGYADKFKELDILGQHDFVVKGNLFITEYYWKPMLIKNNNLDDLLIIQTPDEIINDLMVKSKNKCIEKMTLIFHGDYKNGLSTMEVGDTTLFQGVLSGKNNSDISNLFKKIKNNIFIKLCEPCQIVLNSCDIGKLSTLNEDIKRATGCSVTSYPYKVTPSGAKHFLEYLF